MDGVNGVKKKKNGGRRQFKLHTAAMNSEKETTKAEAGTDPPRGRESC